MNYIRVIKDIIKTILVFISMWLFIMAYVGILYCLGYDFHTPIQLGIIPFSIFICLGMTNGVIIANNINMLN